MLFFHYSDYYTASSLVQDAKSVYGALNYASASVLEIAAEEMGTIEMGYRNPIDFLRRIAFRSLYWTSFIFSLMVKTGVSPNRASQHAVGDDLRSRPTLEDD